MANIRLIQGRIKTAKNIAKITKAMELVAASKMKKAQLQALSGKMYADKIYEMVMRLAAKTDYSKHPFMSRKNELSGKKMVILISSNKGLCGGLNTNLFRFVLNTYQKENIEVLTMGRKGADFAVRSKKSIVADFSESSSFIPLVPAIVEMATEKFISGEYDCIDLVYSEFFSAVNQSPKSKTILPLALEAVPDEQTDISGEYLIEPNVSEVFNALLPHYIENQIRDAILQAEASEHSARMVAMRNATDNANSLIGDLTLVYNKVRQEKITYEITDMVTARLASEA
ncbi:ATP synthase F1 subunit gamma [Patescibacteria group bacterium]